MSATLPTRLFTMPAALRDLLLAWTPLAEVDIATGPRRTEALEGLAVAADESTSEAMHFDLLTDAGTLRVVADATVQGTGEEAIEAARARASELLAETIAAVSQAAGGDPTVDDSVSWSGPPYRFREEANEATLIGSTGAHYYAASVTISYGARIVQEA